MTDSLLAAALPNAAVDPDRVLRARFPIGLNGLLGRKVELPRNTESIIDPTELFAETVVIQRHQHLA